MDWSSLPIHDEISMDQDSSPIYDVCCDDEVDEENGDKSNNNHEKLETERKDRTVVVASEKEFIGLNYDDLFDYVNDTSLKKAFIEIIYWLRMLIIQRCNIQFIIQDKKWKGMNCKYKFVMLNMK